MLAPLVLWIASPRSPGLDPGIDPGVARNDEARNDEAGFVSSGHALVSDAERCEARLRQAADAVCGSSAMIKSNAAPGEGGVFRERGERTRELKDGSRQTASLNDLATWSFTGSKASSAVFCAKAPRSLNWSDTASTRLRANSF
jgi:hypothetical protein